MNQCWYVSRGVQVKRKYDLTMDAVEAQKAREILNSCTSCDLQVTDPPPTPAPEEIFLPDPCKELK